MLIQSNNAIDRLFIIYIMLNKLQPLNVGLFGVDSILKDTFIH